jgi:hypothetical protein
MAFLDPGAFFGTNPEGARITYFLIDRHPAGITKDPVSTYVLISPRCVH